MKKVFLFLCLFSVNLAFGQWEISDFTPRSGMFEVDFPSVDAAYIIGDHGHIYKSSDQGISWEEIYDFGVYAGLNDLQFINAEIGFLRNGNFHYRTFDGGESWTEFGKSWRNFRISSKLEIFDTSLYISYVSNDTSYIKKSIDLGDTWTNLFQNYIVDSQPYVISIVDTSNIYFIHPSELDRVYKTDHDFLSIDTSFVTNGNMVLQEKFDFVDIENGFFYGSWGSHSHPTRTWNAGIYYFPVNLDGFGVLPVLDLEFRTTNLYASSLYGKIFYSSNKGKNWTEQSTLLNDPIYSISFINNDQGIAISRNKILYTSNGGIVGTSDTKDLTSFVNIYPNPVKDILNIQPSKDIQIKGIELLDIRGKVIKEFRNNEMALNFGSISKGKYVLKLTTNRGIVSKTVLIE